MAMEVSSSERQHRTIRHPSKNRRFNNEPLKELLLDSGGGGVGVTIGGGGGGGGCCDDTTCKRVSSSLRGGSKALSSLNAHSLDRGSKYAAK